MKDSKVTKAVAKLGWVSFAGYIVSSICGADKLTVITGFTTTACACIVNGVKAVDEINDIVKA